MKATPLFCAVLALVSVAADPPPIPKSRIEFFERTEASRDRIMRSVEPKLIEMREQVDNLKSAKVNPKHQGVQESRVNGKTSYVFASEESKRKSLQTATDKLSALEKQWKYAANFKSPFRGDDYAPHRNGDSGTISNVFLKQKIKDDEGLIDIHYSVAYVKASGARGLDDRVTIGYVRGIDIKDIADGRAVDVGFVECIGTHTYQSLSGPRSVPLYIPAKNAEIDEQYQRWVVPKLKAAEVAKKHLADAKAKADGDQAERAKQAATDAREKKAGEALNGARFHYDSGSKTKAKDRLREIIKDYADTKAAKEAEELLKKW